MSDHHMRTDWRLVSVRSTASLLQAMAIISDGRLGIALVVNENDHLLGTVTDGDVRRAILNHVTIDSPVSSVMEKGFTAVSPETTLQEVFRLMRSRSIRQVPVCAGDGRVIGLHVIEDFIDELERDLKETGEKEIPSHILGEKIMEKLHDLDDVAYVRFASVYREFKDVNDFVSELKTLLSNQ